MFKKTVIYVDFDGVERKEDFYFNLTEAECLEMEMGVTGGMTKLLQNIIGEKDPKRIVEYMKDLVLRAYGERDPDGKHFMKSDDIKRKFSCSAAYSKIFMEFATDAKAAAEFARGILPANLRGKEPEKIAAPNN
jgi:hypothetical protein